MKTIFALVAGVVMAAGLVQAQETPTEGKVAEMPAYRLAFENLSKEKKQSYIEKKIKVEQYYRQKRIFECLEQIHDAAKIFDQDPGLWNIQGSCYVEFRAFKKARESFRKALVIEPKNEGVLFNLAEMDFVTKNWEGSVDKFSSFTDRLEEGELGEMGPKLELHRLSKFKIMLSLLKLDRVDEAKAIAEKYEEFDDTPFSYYSKASLAYFEGDEAKANEFLGSAFRVFGSLKPLANWQDTLIEFGYIKSFYGGEEGTEIDLGEDE